MNIPKNCSFSEGDWNSLSKMWHAVAYTDEVTQDKPFSATLLDVDLVLYRTKKNEVVVAKSTCPHRGGNLCDGTMDDGALVCPYHAFHYGSAGHCEKIPAHPNMKIPDKMSLVALPVIERYDLIWTCLEQEPISPLPQWEILEKDSTEIIRIHGPKWNVSAARHCENFHDPAHFGWVHRETFGASNFLDVPDFKVNREKFTMTHHNIFKQIDREAFNIESEVIGTRLYDYHFTFPYCNGLIVKPTEDNKNQNIDWFGVYDVAQPISATQCRVFLQIARDGSVEQAASAEEVVEFQKALVSEDLAVVEKINPLELSLDFSDQILVPSDTWSVNYRRGLADLGLTTGMPVKA